MNIFYKFGVYLGMLPVAAMIAGLYGAAHDQISYTVSPEYFTRFKFIQFDLPWAYDNPRLGAAYVGFLATWWMGVFVAIPLGLFGFMFRKPRQMAANLAGSLLAAVMVALLTGLIGLAYGYQQVTEQTITAYRQWIPSTVTDPVQFMRVGVMHDASYLGGLTGLIAGITYLILAKWRAVRLSKRRDASCAIH